jgi:hypothetical protein
MLWHCLGRKGTLAVGGRNEGSGAEASKSVDKLARDSAQSATIENMSNDSRHEVAIRRSPRYARFVIVGCGLGVVAALALTALLPSAPPYSPLQVFGFLMLIIGSVGGALGAAFALILDRVWAGRQIRAIAGRIEANSTQT